ncbi:MAG: FMN-binding protein [Oscillospiraceae bacterium]|jgi:electron transport complex protein RnfG
MKDFTKFRDGFIGPVIILAVITLAITWAVAATYQLTFPEIEKAEFEKARLARIEVLPDADDFAQYDTQLPEGVLEAYRANNGAGFVFQASAKGYDGQVPFMIGIDAQGKIVGIKMMTNNETKGLGSRVGEPEYLNLFLGLEGDPYTVDSITGATKTSNALKNSLRAAQQAYEQLKDMNP